MVRVSVHFRGRVQGVGFRYTAVNMARDYDVTGFVQNLPDGAVKLVVEGERSEVRRFLDGLKAEMSGHIKTADEVEAPATGEFRDFRIQH
jgi:acylphosphatase